MTTAAGPVFVAGADRSGVGLVGDLLDAHPAFAISRRTNFWTFYWGRFGDLGEEANLDRCLRAMMSFRRIQDLDVDPVRLKSEFLASFDRGYGRLFEVLGSQHAERRGKPRWGDKSLNCERYADTILGEYRDGRMVHVIRDPRDRHASVTDHRGSRRGGAAGAAAVWSESIRRAEVGLESYEGRYHVIRYEDLVANPGPVLASLCHFLGEEYHPAMLAGIGGSGEDSDPQRLFNSASVGRYRDDIARRESAFMDRVLGRQMRAWGYEADDRPPSIRERLLVDAVDIPLGRLLMIVWRPWSAAKSAFSSGPSSRRLVEGTPGL